MADNLPVDIILDIFSRLPVDKVFDCRRVCNTWRNHLSSIDKTNFAAMHLRHIRHHHDRKVINNGVVSEVSTHGLIFFNRSKVNENMWYGEYDDDINSTNQNEPCMQNKLRLINHSLPTRAVSSRLVDSCNGLICLAELIINEEDEKTFLDPIHIYNPITREYLCLPGFNENNEYSGIYVQDICSGFGYSPQTNEYKVVRIIHAFNGTLLNTIQVYTLGDGSGWRNIEVTKNPLFSYKLFGVFFNEAIHWLDWNGRDVWVFNLSDETFHVLPQSLPNWEYCQYNRILHSWGEWLCVIGWNTSTHFYVWTYKKGESWTWCKEFSIVLENLCVTNIPLALTKSGSILFLSYETSHPTDKTLFCYYPKTAVMRSLVIWDSIQSIPHTNSFVSLKDLGETTCEESK